MKLKVPFIHQLWDTPDDFNGHWACGPTSLCMVLAYYGLLQRKSTVVKTPVPHISPWGWYLSNRFSQGSFIFDNVAGSRSGFVPGLYGTALDNHPKVGWVTGPYKTKYQASRTGRGLEIITEVFGVSSKITASSGKFIPSEVFRKKISESIIENHPVIVGGIVNGYGHVIVITGFEQSGSYWANDPYGRGTTGKYTGQGGALYTYSQINPRWIFQVEV